MIEHHKPCLVETGRGLTVQFQNRFLYSRFDPSKNARLTAAQTIIQPETLVLCISPLLGYGLEVLLDNLNPSSYILALECDENLMAVSAPHINQNILDHPSFKYIRTSSIERVLETIDQLNAGPFRRCIRIDLSGGAALYGELYGKIVSHIDEYISRYWRNHLTLMKLGRNYARNLLRNCTLLADSFRIPEDSSSLPVFVAGAGPSLDDSISFIRTHRKSFFLLAVDTALKTLNDAHIKPDAIILVESQFWIEKAFIGFAGSNIPVYADMTARTNAITATGGPIHFFFSEYADTRFVKRFLKAEIAPLVIPPLGSVGLVALFLARLIAKKNTNVYFSGLDFSYGKQFTHSKGAPSVSEIMNTSTRFFPAGNAMACFGSGVYQSNGKNNEQVYTDPSLSGYAHLCEAQFGKISNIFDVGQTGLRNGCIPVSEIDATKTIMTTHPRSNTEQQKVSIDICTITSFLENEKTLLSELKNILCGFTVSEDTEEKVKSLVTELDYLFCHFPDGYKGYSAEKSFLNRVRIELEYYLKTLNHLG